MTYDVPRPSRGRGPDPRLTPADHSAHHSAHHRLTTG